MITCTNCLEKPYGFDSLCSGCSFKKYYNESDSNSRKIFYEIIFIGGILIKLAVWYFSK